MLLTADEKQLLARVDNAFLTEWRAHPVFFMLCYTVGVALCVALGLFENGHWALDWVAAQRVVMNLSIFFTVLFVLIAWLYRRAAMSLKAQTESVKAGLLLFKWRVLPLRLSALITALLALYLKSAL